jgi:hypothetical protein
MLVQTLALLTVATLTVAAPGLQADHSEARYEQPQPYNSENTKQGHEYDRYTNTYGPMVTVPSTESSASSTSTTSSVPSASSEYVKGAAFDRITIIYLETTPYDDAVANGGAQEPSVFTLLISRASRLSGSHPTRSPVDQQLRRWVSQPAELHRTC